MLFNFLAKNKNVTTNHEGEKAFVLTPEYELYTAVATTGVGNAFYESGNDRLQRIIDLMKKCDPVFIAKLAVYTRNELYLRSIPLVLTVELVKLHSGDNLIAKTVNGVVQRADEITELLAYYQMANNRNGIKKLNALSKQIQKGLGASFNKFDAYQFAKYNRPTAVKLKDALFLVHPKADSDAQQMVFNQIATDTLKVPYTWETELSALGQNAFENEAAKVLAFRSKWEELIFSGKLGYMALMRNLRNILDARVSVEAILKVCQMLTDKNAVSKAKQLPFRYLAAYRELQKIDSDFTVMVLNALEDAVLQTASNIKGFDYRTSVLIACDVSGSMQKPVSAKSSVFSYDIGLMLGMLLQSQCERVTSGMFGDIWKVVNLPQKSILANVQEYYKREGEVGYSTNGYLILDYLINRKKRMDKIMLFTDCQLWDSRNGGNTLQQKWNVYKSLFPNAKLYLFDLSGYGHSPVDMLQLDVYLIAGWSDKVFDILDSLDNAETALDKIQAMQL